MASLLDQPAWTVAELEDLVRRGDFAAILDRSGVTKAAPDDWYDLIVNMIVDAAATVDLPQATVVGPSHPQVVLWASRYAGSTIRQVTEETRAAIRALIVDALAFGGPPRVIARDIASVVGLDSRSAQAVVNYRRELEAALREQRSIAALRRRWSLAPGRRPPGSAHLDIDGRIDAMTEAYRSRLLRRRAENIARTELQIAVHRGQDIVWQDVLGRDRDLRGRAARVWIATEGARTCALCSALDGQVVGFDDEFSGPASTARDAEIVTVGQLPPRHPSCRCTTGLRFGR